MSKIKLQVKPNFSALNAGVECPVCGQAHGGYQNLRDAHQDRLCPVCSRKMADKIKREIERLDDPEHRIKPLGKLMAARRVKEALGEEEEEDSEANELEAAALPSIYDLAKGRNWIDASLFLFNLETARHHYVDSRDHQEYDPKFPESADDVDRVIVRDAFGNRYIIYRDYDTAEETALKLLVDDLENQAELFDSEWLKSWIDEEALRSYLPDAAEEWENDIRRMHDDELVELLIKEGYLDEDEYAEAAPEEQRKMLDNAMEDYIDQEKPAEPDVWDVMDELYGRNAIRQAVEWVGLKDYEAAARDIIRFDGIPGYYRELSNGAVVMEY